MTEIAIQASDLNVQKSKHPILTNLTFTVQKGSLTGLIGPSGSGKTTLMRAIVGVQRYKGNLAVYGKPAGDATLRRVIGYVTQSPAVYTDLTVEQNLRYFATLVGSKANDVTTVIEQVSLQKQKKQLVESLSGGQKARVGLAVALLGSPQLLVLDEPTVGLDPILRNELWKLFRNLASQGKTLLISSHVMDEAERCDNLLLMRDGELLWQDTRAKLLTATNKKDVGDAFVAVIENKERM